MPQAAANPVTDPRTNVLLSALPPDDYRAVTSEAEVVSLKLNKQLAISDEPIRAVYFPLNCMVSVAIATDDGTGIEILTVGREGAEGAVGAMLTGKAVGTSIIQVPGSALRMDVRAFRRVCTRAALQGLLRRYCHAALWQMALGAVCNRLHSADKRCARWLLMAGAHTGNTDFLITQEYLSQMLGVHPTRAKSIIATMKKAGLIRNSRGQITIVDPAGLHSLACECYGMIQQQFASLRSAGPVPSGGDTPPE